MNIKIGNKNIEIESELLNGDVLFSILNGRETKEEKSTDFTNAINDLNQASREKYPNRRNFLLWPSPASNNYKDYQHSDQKTCYLYTDKDRGALFYYRRENQVRQFLSSEEQHLLTLQSLIDSLDKAVLSGISYDAFPLLSELAYRTALKIRNSTHLGNNERYPVLLQKIKNRADASDFSILKVIAASEEIVLGAFTFTVGLGLAPFTGCAVAATGAALCAEGWRNLKQADQPSAAEQYRKINISHLQEENPLPALSEHPSQVAEAKLPSQPHSDALPLVPEVKEVKTQITQDNIVLLDDVLFYILNGRETEAEKIADFRDAVTLLKQVIDENGYGDNPALHTLVDSLDDAIISKASPHDFPLWTEIAYRTALQLDNQEKGNNFENLFIAWEKVQARANNTQDTRWSRLSAVSTRALFALEATLGFFVFVGGLCLTCSGFLPGIAVMAAGAAIFGEGMRNCVRTHRQVEGTEHAQKINISLTHCASTLFPGERGRASSFGVAAIPGVTVVTDIPAKTPRNSVSAPACG